MRIYIAIIAVCSSILLGSSVSAQEPLTLTATLDSQSPVAFSISQVAAQNIDVARVTLTATGGDVYISGLYLTTDSVAGLSNFTDIKVYDTYDSSLLGTYSVQSGGSALVHFNNTRIGLGLSKTYLIRASLTSGAAGVVRIGFSGVTDPALANPVLSGFPVFGNLVTLSGTVATPTPTPSLTPAPTPLGTPIPQPISFVSLAALGLTEGDTISAGGSSDPDIYIANEFGYKRLFLNPVIFNFYGHLGGFGQVKNISSQTRDVLRTSSYFRNCETNDPKIYSVEVTGEDTGTLHWINTSGTQATYEDPDFFKKVFCINTNEFSWYTKGSEYASVLQVQQYQR